MNRWFALAFLTVLAFFLLAGARREDDGSSAEFVLGSYTCSAGSEAAYIFMNFQATGGVMDPEAYLQHQPPVASSPAETCDPRAAAMRDLLTRQGCALGATGQYQDDQGGVQRNFSFVCEGSRGRVVRSLAAAARAMIDADVQ